MKRYHNPKQLLLPFPPLEEKQKEDAKREKERFIDPVQSLYHWQQIEKKRGIQRHSERIPLYGGIPDSPYILSPSDHIIDKDSKFLNKRNWYITLGMKLIYQSELYYNERLDP